MTLFEIRTGYIGESYERAYVWCENVDEARVMYDMKHKGRPFMEIEELFSADSVRFVTKLSSDGFMGQWSHA